MFIKSKLFVALAVVTCSSSLYAADMNIDIVATENGTVVERLELPLPKGNPPDSTFMLDSHPLDAKNILTLQSTRLERGSRPIPADLRNVTGCARTPIVQQAIRKELDNVRL